MSKRYIPKRNLKMQNLKDVYSCFLMHTVLWLTKPNPIYNLKWLRRGRRREGEREHEKEGEQGAHLLISSDFSAFYIWFIVLILGPEWSLSKSYQQSFSISHLMWFDLCTSGNCISQYSLGFFNVCRGVCRYVNILLFQNRSVCNSL